MQKIVQEKTITNLVDAFDKAALEAFQKLVSLMRERKDNTAPRASESILDRPAIAPKPSQQMTEWANKSGFFVAS